MNMYVNPLRRANVSASSAFSKVYAVLFSGARPKPWVLVWCSSCPRTSLLFLVAKYYDMCYYYVPVAVQ